MLSYASCFMALSVLALFTRSAAFVNFSSLPDVRRLLLALPRRRFSCLQATLPDTKSPSIFMDPAELGPIPFPKSLSPSSILEFKKCPQSFLLQYLYNIKQPTTAVLAKGTMCHAALEQVFDLEPEERTLENLQNLFRSHWAQHRQSYAHLFVDGDDDDWNIDAEREWGQSALQLLHNYVHVEDPSLVQRPNPVQREIWVRANLSIHPELGVTSLENHKIEAETAPDTFLVRGIVDRLDMVKSADNGSVVLRLVDYKTGKAPNFQYSASMNAKIAHEAMEQLKIYALLLRESQLSETASLDLRYLRLLYLTSEQGNGRYLDYDLGPTQAERDAELQAVHQDLAFQWTRICHLVSLQDPRAWEPCNRSFCYCHQCRPQFLPGTLMEPTSDL